MRTGKTKRGAAANSQKSDFDRFKYVYCSSNACRRLRRCLAKRRKQSCKSRDPKPDWTPDDAENLRLLREALEEALARADRETARKIAAGEPVEDDEELSPEEEAKLFRAEIERVFGQGEHW